LFSGVPPFVHNTSVSIRGIHDANYKSSSRADAWIIQRVVSPSLLSTTVAKLLRASNRCWPPLNVAPSAISHSRGSHGPCIDQFTDVKYGSVALFSPIRRMLNVEQCVETTFLGTFGQYRLMHPVIRQRSVNTHSSTSIQAEKRIISHQHTSYTTFTTLASFTTCISGAQN
jgi:hypothetical protein